MDRLAYLIEKFWEGKATEKEKKEMLWYLEQHNPEWRSQLEQEFSTDELSESALKIERAKQIFARIQSVTDAEEKATLSRMRLIRPFMRIAAAVVVILFGLGVAVHLQNKQLAKIEMATLVPTLDTIVYKNTNQADLMIRLEDGSNVSLKCGSSIAYVSHFDVDKRNVFLEGEATFEVAKDTLRPFTVWAEGYSTTALGTTFSVRAYQADVFKVNLYSGKVVVRSSFNSTVPVTDVYLAPGEELIVNPFNGIWTVTGKAAPSIPVAKKKVQSEQKTKVSEETKNDLLVFDKTTLDEVFRRIAKKYEVNIDLSGVDLRKLSFTGDFQPTDSLDVVIGIICNMNDLFYHKEEREIRIEKNN